MSSTGIRRVSPCTSSWVEPPTPAPAWRTTVRPAVDVCYAVDGALVLGAGEDAVGEERVLLIAELGLEGGDEFRHGGMGVRTRSGARPCETAECKRDAHAPRNTNVRNCMAVCTTTTPGLARISAD